MQRHGLILGGMLFVFLGSAFGQTAAVLVGSVKDPSGAVLPGVTVVAKHLETNEERQDVTNEVGDFRIPLVNIGQYAIRAQLSGFKTAALPKVLIQLGQTARIDMTLEIGEVTDTVTVSDTGPLVRSETVSLGEVMDNRKILELPLNGRQFLQLATLSPGVSARNTRIDRGTSTNKAGALEISGGRAGHNNFRLDGLDNTDLQYNDIAAVPPVDSILEFQVARNMYDAEYGRASGGVIDVKLRSGTNRLHGSLYEFHRNSALDARNFFSLSKTPFRFNQFGATGGGPIRRDKTFVFSNYEGFREGKADTQLWYVPTPAERAGDFSQSSTRPLDPATGQRFPDDRIPQDLWNPVGQKLIGTLPLPNSSDPVFNYVSSESATREFNDWVTRVDHSLNNKQRLGVSFVYDRRFRLEPNLNKYTAQSFQQNGYAAAVNHVFQITNTIVNETRLGYARLVQFRDSLDKSDYSKDFGFGLPPQGPNFAGPPRILITAPVFKVYFGNSARPNAWKNNNYNIVNILSFRKGTHSFKFGFDGKRNHVNWVAASAPTGNWDIRGTYAQNRWAELLLGLVSNVNAQPFANWQYLRRSLVGFYLQDDWKVSSRLTMNIGLRWDVNTAYKVPDKRMATFDVTTGQLVYPKGAPLTQKDLDNFRFPYRVDGPDTAHDTNWGNLGPRFGLAFRPRGDSNLVVRGGYGIFYSPVSGFVTVYTTLVAPWMAAFNITGTLANPIYLDFNNHGQKITFDGPITNAGTIYTPAGRKFRDLSNQQWNLSIEKAVMADLALEVAYIGNKQVHVSGSGLGQGFAQRYIGAASYPGFASLFLRTDGFNAEHNAFQFKANKRFSHGLSFLSSYTWSKTLADVSNDSDFLLDLGGTTWDLRQLWARADFDVRHLYSLSGIWEIPVGSGRGYLSDLHGVPQAILGGWRANYIFQANSGYPLDLLSAVGGRPNLVSGRTANLPASERTIDRWFDRSAFERPAAGKLGNLAHNAIDGPGFKQLDLGIAKVFSLPKEGHTLEFRSELFNVFNHPNLFFNGNRNFDATGAEKLDGVWDSRSIQFALRYSF